MHLDGKIVKNSRLEGNIFTIVFNDGTELVLEPGVQPSDNGLYRLGLGMKLTTSMVLQFPQTLIMDPSYTIQCRGNNGIDEVWANLPRDALISLEAATNEARMLSLHAMIYGQVRVVDKGTGAVHRLFNEGKEVII